jgi:S-disulfanyl-L-cysteine oxidoreductase SoxD
MPATIGRVAIAAVLTLSGPVVADDSEQVRQGEALFGEYCALCHGTNGRGGPGYANPIWGPGAQIRKFKHAQGLFEYHQLLMPFNNPLLLTDEQKWAVTVYVLVNHAVLKRTDTLDPAKAGEVTIP